MFIPLAAPDIGTAEIAAVKAVLESGCLSRGPELEAFEAITASHARRSHAVGVSSGSAALHLGLIALGIGAGDEVITTAFTVPAVANAILAVAAKPVFVDCSLDDWNMDVATVAAAIGPATAAILVVHVAGRPANMPAFRDLAETNGLSLIEDASEALGGYLANRPLGSFGDISVFSYYANKQVTAAEAGMLLTDDAILANRVRRLRNHGRDDTGAWLDQMEWGLNYRLSELHAALGRVQMSRLDEILKRRRDHAQAYYHYLKGQPAIQLPSMDPGSKTQAWFVFMLQLQHAGQRDHVWQAMRTQGIQCGRYFAALHLQPYFRQCHNYQKGQLPNTESLALRSLALPFYTRMCTEQIQIVCQGIESSLSQINGPETDRAITLRRGAGEPADG